MATIQIREIPEDDYEVLRRRARAAGQSIQNYMRAQVIEMARTRTTDEALAGVDSARDAERQGLDREFIVAALDAERR